MENIFDNLKQQHIQQQRTRFEPYVDRLEQHLSVKPDMWNLMKSLDCIVAGGFWTSVFTSQEINDVDVYFRDVKSLNTFVASCMNNLECMYEDDPENFVDIDKNEDIPLECTIHCAGYTDKSVIFMADGLTIQCIHTKFYDSPQEIFDTFDYTINMCAYDFKQDLIVMDDRFFPDVCARRLIVNPKTSFPIISQLRIQKYKERGYHINRKEFLKLACAVAALKLDSWDDAIKQLAGMYGWVIDEVFDKTKPFSMLELIEQMDNIAYKPDAVMSIKDGDCEHILEMLKEQHDLVNLEEKVYYYKAVKKTDEEGVYKSLFGGFGGSDGITYKIGEEVQDKDNNGVYLFKRKKLAREYHQSGKTAVIKLEVVDKPKADLVSDGGQGKYRTRDKLRVLEVVEVESDGNGWGIPMAPNYPSLPY